MPKLSFVVLLFAVVCTQAADTAFGQAAAARWFASEPDYLALLDAASEDADGAMTDRSREEDRFRPVGGYRPSKRSTTSQ